MTCLSVVAGHPKASVRVSLAHSTVCTHVCVHRHVILDAPSACVEGSMPACEEL